MKMFIISIFVFFFNDTATTEIYTLSLHDALPIFNLLARANRELDADFDLDAFEHRADYEIEEHTSELQSRFDLVCRLLLEKKTPKISHSHAIITYAICVLLNCYFILTSLC